MKSIFVGIKNVLLWSYERGTWQYDLLCLLIIGAVFLLPGKYFGDRDRTSVKTVQATGMVREVSMSELQEFLQKQNKSELVLNSPQEAIVLYLRDQLKQNIEINKYEPFMNPQGRVGYRVWLK
ncbi:MAG TPA: hypothetical protein PLD20_01640 [Blastocatellia bacterium]|nr:hypothetical protein [Blastocatellia bacterium]HMV87403.1 hypothetical protein [Blastocatellia bacterium]HMX29655.1 hypothetical protein [Blastocatellia bacterium]HMY75708.1 hypothetical protein [Blastocatellia bacterium]HMZ16638.1 hypothetical protein [Blastocatellia bacterium]